MKPVERRIAFAYGVLLTAKHNMEHVVSLIRQDRDFGEEFNNINRLPIWDAMDAVERAATSFEKEVNALTKYEEKDETDN